MLILRGGMVWKVGADGSQSQATPNECATEIERLHRALGFVALWCYRRSNVSDAERISAIKYHPEIKKAAEDARLDLGQSPDSEGK